MKNTSRLSAKDVLFDEFCPICGGDCHKGSIEVTVEAPTDFEVFLYECDSCGHWWINPRIRQSTLNGLYASADHLVVSPNYTAPPAYSEAFIEKYVNQFLPRDRELGEIRFLEIGIGRGDVFQYMARRAASAWGVEPGKWRLSVPNVVASIEELPKELTFDVILIQDVLEHLESPVQMLTSARRHAANGCLLRCGFPNKDSLGARVKKSQWRMMTPYAHLHFFSAKSLSRMFETAGWKVVKKYSFWSALDLREVVTTNFDGISFRSVKRLMSQLLLGRDQWNVNVSPLE